MKLNFQSVNLSQFDVRAGDINGRAVILIQPKHIGSPVWTADNLMFRSSVWDANTGELLSAGYKKFFNMGEQPVLFPPLKGLGGAEVLEKMDGSCLIISPQNDGSLVIRTRGTFDAHALQNGAEVPELLTKYQKFFDYCKTCRDVSFLVEWFTNSNKIVLNYGPESKLWLTGVVRHSDYSLLAQTLLDSIAEETEIGRPRRFSFDSIESMVQALAVLEGEEGFCIYSNNGQRIDKAKSARYLILHKMKSDLSNFDKLVDLWLAIEEPKYSQFYQHISDQFDWELAEYCKAEISRICDAAKHMADIEAGMIAFVERIKGQPRKQQAERIFASYGKNSNRASMVFHVLDGKGLTKEDKKKLIMQFMVA